MQANKRVEMKKGKVRTWREFLNITGGSKGLCRALSLERHTVLAWCAERRGIPEKHWPDLVAKFAVSFEELLAVSEYLKALPVNEKSK